MLPREPLTPAREAEVRQAIACLGGEESATTPGVFSFDNCNHCTLMLDQLREEFPDVDFWGSFDLLGIRGKKPIDTGGQS